MYTICIIINVLFKKGTYLSTMGIMKGPSICLFKLGKESMYGIKEGPLK